MNTRRYFRPTISNPEGTIVHDGDCRFWDIRICTCGLLHYLLYLENPSEIYSKFDEEAFQQWRILEMVQDRINKGETDVCQ